MENHRCVADGGSSSLVFHVASAFLNISQLQSFQKQPAGLLRFSRAQSFPILWAHVGIILVKLKKKPQQQQL